MAITDIINDVGDRIPQWTDSALSSISQMGLEANDLSARLVSIILILAILWGVLHFSSGLKKPIIWIIKILGVVLIASILFATFV